MKSLVAAIAVATLGLSLAACGSTASTPSAAPTKAPAKVSKPSKSDFTDTVMAMAWNQQSKSDQVSACAGWRIAPDLILQAFENGAGAETMAELDEDEVKSFFDTTCADLA